MNPLQWGIAGLALMLVISMGGNVFLFNSRDTAITERASAVTALTGEKAVSKQCSDGVDAVKKEQDARTAELIAATARATAAARALESKAGRTMQAQPVNPKDLCASATALSQQKLAERRQPSGGKNEQK